MPRWHDAEPITPSKEIWIHLKGAWRLQDLPDIVSELSSSPLKTGGQQDFHLYLDGSKLETIDTASAQAFLKWLLSQFPGMSHKELHWAGLKREHERLIELVLNAKFQDRSGKIRRPQTSMVVAVGKGSIEVAHFCRELVGFLGETVIELLRTVGNPRRLRVRELFVQLELVGVNAIPIVALVTFLIGVVVAYLFGIQIQKYGANIFIVDGCGIAMCRELSPILTAIIVAGRSGSAFTAQLGAMKINEEVDALSVLGLSPVRVLVVPRALALMLAMPLLVFVGDILGVLGSMVIADLRLGVTGITFLERLRQVLTIRSFSVGLMKAPVFAFFIAIIGCQMGLNVEGNARSLGTGTTATVVRSIVAVILLNAGFAILFSELGI